MPNAAGERRPTYDDAAEAKKNLLGGPSAPVGGSAEHRASLQRPVFYLETWDLAEVSGIPRHHDHPP
jgi:hypothetical protein